MKNLYYKIVLDSKSQRIKDDNGYLIIKDNPIALSGVFDYLVSEIDENAKDKDKIVKVCRTFKDLSENKDLFANKPILWEHSWTGNDSKNQRADGSIGSDIEARDGGLYADLIIYNADLIKAIENNKCKELSPGYECEVVKENGNYDGEAYEYKQLLKNVNHLAVVENGRSGHELKIQDKGINMAKQTFKKLLDSLKAILDEEAKKQDNEVVEEDDDEVEDEVETKDNEIQKETKDNDEVDTKDNDEVKDKKTCDDDDDDDDEIEVVEVDEEDDDDDEIKINDTLNKIIELKVKKAMNKERKRINDTQSAINKVKAVVGNFDSSNITSSSQAYKLGYEAISGNELASGLDSKTAFEMVKNNLRVNRKVQDRAMKSDSEKVNKALSRFK